MPRKNCNDEKYHDPVDSEPVELILGNPNRTMKDEIMEQVRALLQAEKDEIYETIEEFTDFDIPDEDDDPISSQYEVKEMQEEFIEPVEPASPAGTEDSPPPEASPSPSQEPESPAP